MKNYKSAYARHVLLSFAIMALLAPSSLVRAQSPTTSATSIALSTSTSTYGSLVVIIATVSPTVPNGETITFYANGVPIGIGTTLGGGAALTTTSLPVGTDQITASYAGDAYYTTSTSAAIAEAVGPAPTSTSVTLSASTSTYGVPVVVIATVSPTVPNGETVEFYANGAPIGTGVTTGGVATLATNMLPSGTDQITASYAGDADYATSSTAAIAETVRSAPTSTSVALSTPTSTYGSSVVVTATVSPAVPNGETVTFYDNGVPLGTGTTTEGVATLSTTALPSGTDQITASYVGDANHTTSTSITEKVDRAPTSTSVTLSTQNSTYGSLVVIVATVSPTIPKGEAVTFYDNGIRIGTKNASGGVAVLSITALPIGTDQITASYSGDANYATSTSDAVAETVIPEPSTTIVPATSTAHATTTILPTQGADPSMPIAKRADPSLPVAVPMTVGIAVAIAVGLTYYNSRKRRWQ